MSFDTVDPADILPNKSRERSTVFWVIVYTDAEGVTQIHESFGGEVKARKFVESLPEDCNILKLYRVSGVRVPKKKVVVSF